MKQSQIGGSRFTSHLAKKKLIIPVWLHFFGVFLLFFLLSFIEQRSIRERERPFRSQLATYLLNACWLYIQHTSLVGGLASVWSVGGQRGKLLLIPHRLSIEHSKAIDLMSFTEQSKNNAIDRYYGQSNKYRIAQYK